MDFRKILGLSGKPPAEITALDTLHIGSRIPVPDLKSVKTGRHTLLDPYFASLDKKGLDKLRADYPNFEFVAQRAHEFLKGAISRGIRYKEIRMDSPYAGLVGESSDFGQLCRQMYSVLTPGGTVSILTEFLPNKECTCYKYGDSDDLEALSSFMKGRDFEELSLEKQSKVFATVREEKTTNIATGLRKAGFEVEFHEAKDMKLIDRSEIALKKKRRGKAIYLITAKKP